MSAKEDLPPPQAPSQHKTRAQAEDAVSVAPTPPLPHSESKPDDDNFPMPPPSPPAATALPAKVQGKAKKLKGSLVPESYADRSAMLSALSSIKNLEVFAASSVLEASRDGNQQCLTLAAELRSMQSLMHPDGNWSPSKKHQYDSLVSASMKGIEQYGHLVKVFHRTVPKPLKRDMDEVLGEDDKGKGATVTDVEPAAKKVKVEDVNEIKVEDVDEVEVEDCVDEGKLEE